MRHDLASKGCKMNRRRFLLGVLAAPFVAVWRRLRPDSEEVGLSLSFVRQYDGQGVWTARFQVKNPPIRMSGWTNETLEPGDRFTIGIPAGGNRIGLGLYRVNPETREATEELQEFIAV
jgi:hypothetical protein